MNTTNAYEFDIGGGMVTFRFADKPADKVRSILKAHGFRWNPKCGLWWRRRINGAADVAGAIDKALRPADASDGTCWQCGAPGRFRYHGAATPVLCDDCARKGAAR